MKILHLYKDYFPVVGGIENHVRLLAEGQAARGHQVNVLVTSRDRRTHVETLNGVRLIYAGRLASVSSTPLSAAFPQLLAAQRPDVVHLHFPYPPGEISNLFFGRAPKTVLTYHSDIVRQKYLRLLYRPLMERVLAGVDRIIATSPPYISSSPVLTRWRDKSTVVPLGIDPRLFLSISRPPAALGGGGPFLLFVGQLRYYKGLDYMLRAMPMIPGARLTIVGQGPMEQAWRSLASGLWLDDRVSFVGGVPDEGLPARYASADVFVLPASERSEAFGLVQLEAMASGLPVVSCDVGTGVSWVNIHEMTGLVVPPRDPAALAGAINRLLADAPLRERMGQAGRARVLAEFSADKMVERVLAVYG